MKRLNVQIIFLPCILIILGSCLCSPTPELKIISDKMYGRITADSVDITDEIHSGEYSYYNDSYITFEYIPNENMDVEFLGWYYVTGFFSKVETQLTDSRIYTSDEISYNNIYPKINTPEAVSFYEDPETGDVLIIISKNDEKQYRYLTFENNFIKSITSLPLDSILTVKGVLKGNIYYSKDNILYSYSISDSTENIILDYPNDENHSWKYFETGFILYDQKNPDSTTTYSVVNLDTDETRSFIDTAPHPYTDSFLSKNGNKIIISEEYQENRIISVIDLAAQTKIIIEGAPVLKVYYYFLDIDSSGDVFCCDASYYRQENDGQVYVRDGFKMYVNGEYKYIKEPAYFTDEGWVMPISSDGTTKYYTFDPETIQTTMLFEMPFYKENIQNKLIHKTGKVSFLFETPNVLYSYFNNFHQYGFYNHSDKRIYVIPAANLLNCRIEYLQNYTENSGY